MRDEVRAAAAVLALVYVALVTGAAGDGFSPSIPVGVQINFTISELDDWQPCWRFNYGTAGPTEAQINATCGGPNLFLTCHPDGAFNPLLGAGDLRDIVLAQPGQVNGTVRWFYDDELKWGFTNVSNPEPDSVFQATTPSDMFWRVSNISNRVLASGVCGGVNTISTLVNRTIYATPCAGLSATDACVSPEYGACSPGATCDVGGDCTGGTPVVCPPPPQCQNLIGCDVITGVCEYENKTDGSPCNGTNLCTTGATCQAGVCENGTFPLFPESTPTCNQVDSCDPATGIFTFVAVANGTACTDGLNCTQADRCLADGLGNSTCIGEQIPCNDPIGGCRVNGTCAEPNGTCVYDNIPMGAFCNSSFTGLCAIAGECDGGGVCVETVLKECPPVLGPTLCLGLGTCNNETGLCENRTIVPDFTACDDGSGCTTGDFCEIGFCNAGVPETCATGNVCQFNGLCNSTSNATFTCIPNPNNGVACNQTNLCVNSICDDTVCTPISVVSCPGDQCNDPLAVCDPVTECLNPVANGTLCTLGTCSVAQCLGGQCYETPECPAGVVEWFLVSILFD